MRDWERARKIASFRIISNIKYFLIQQELIFGFLYLKIVNDVFSLRKSFRFLCNSSLMNEISEISWSELMILKF